VTRLYSSLGVSFEPLGLQALGQGSDFFSLIQQFIT